MYCNYCGNQNPDDAAFCSKCGAKISYTGRTAENSENTGQQAETLYNAAGDSAAGAQTAQTGTYTSYNYQYAPKPHTPRSGFFWVCILECILIVIALGGLYFAGSYTTSSQTVAERYFVEVANGEYEETFNELGVEESEFVNAETYGVYNQNIDIAGVTSYSIYDVTYQFNYDYDYEQQIQDILNQFGIDSMGDFSDGQEDGQQDPFSQIFGDGEDDGSEIIYGTDDSTSDIAVYQIDFTTSSDNEIHTVYIQLQKSSEKLYGLFNKWEVVSDGVVASDYHIIVSAGASITFDGKEVSAAYITTDESDYYHAYVQQLESGEEYVVYKLPSVFAGAHEVTVSDKENGDMTVQVYVSGDDDGQMINEMVEKF